MKIGVDRDILRAFLRPVGGERVRKALAELRQLGVILCVLPVIADEIETDGDDVERRWRDASFMEIPADEFLKGCATGIAKRYLDYHPDPRDCRVVAEAECAKMAALVTLNPNLISGLASRAENIRIEKPWRTVARLKRQAEK